VDDGSVLLGDPGAPGCTTTGFPDSVCCAMAQEQKNAMQIQAASRVRFVARLIARLVGLRREKKGRQLAARLKWLIWTGTES